MFYFGILQVNSVGVVVSSYCGANGWWKMPVYATRDVVIEKVEPHCAVPHHGNPADAHL